MSELTRPDGSAAGAGKTTCQGEPVAGAPTLTRRGSLLAGAAALLAPALPRSVKAAQPFRLVVTTTETPVLPNSVMELCLSLGYYRRENVDVEIVRVQQTPSAVAALLSGQGDMANISVDSALQLTARRQGGFKAVLSPNKSLPYMIASKASVEAPKDLAGKSFGVGRVGSLDHSLSSVVLQRMGLDESAVRYVNIGQPNVRAQALAAGRIDATTISLGVWLSVAQSGGLKMLVSEPDFYAAAPVVNKVNVVPDGLLRSRASEVAAVTRAIVLASRDFAREPGLWAEAMEKERPDVPRKDLDQLAAAFRKSWSVNGGLNKSEIEFTTDWNYKTEDFRDLRRPELAEWVDFSVVAGVLKQIGTSPDQDPPQHT